MKSVIRLSKLSEESIWNTGVDGTFGPGLFSCSQPGLSHFSFACSHWAFAIICFILGNLRINHSQVWDVGYSDKCISKFYGLLCHVLVEQALSRHMKNRLTTQNTSDPTTKKKCLKARKYRLLYTIILAYWTGVGSYCQNSKHQLSWRLIGQLRSLGKAW